MRRFANSLSSRSRTHYFALLCNAAIRRNHSEIDENELYEILLSDELGGHLNIVSSKVKRNGDAFGTRLRLVKNGSNRSWPRENADLRSFDLIVDHNGPSIRVFE